MAFFYNRKSCSAAGSCRAEPTSVADLSQLQPQLQHEWHPQKNQHLGTAQLHPYSFVKAIWRCPDCHHEWPARVIDRACNQAGCQQCAQRQSCAVVRCHSCLSGITSPMGSWEYSQTRYHRTVIRRCFGFATSVHRNGLMGGSSPHLTGLELLIHAVHYVMESKHASATMHLAESSPMHPEKIWYI